MPRAIGQTILRWFAGLTTRYRRFEYVAIVPAVGLLAYEAAGLRGLALVAVALPMVAMFARPGGGSAGRTSDPARDSITGLVLRDELTASLDRALTGAPDSGRSTGCFVIVLDELEQLSHRHGHAAKMDILRRTADRLQGALRQVDTAARLDGGTFAVALGETRRPDLENMLQLAVRLQSALDAPIRLERITIQVTSSIGFCLAARAPHQTGSALLDAAETAATEARRSGPGAIRSFTVELQTAQTARHAMCHEIEVALESGQIVAHFQPQVSTDTGEVTGFEALARWHHPERGLLRPADFLDTLREAGLSERLSEVMVIEALNAVTAWDRAGIAVPTVAVNFSSDELRNPRLAEKLKWELDRFDLSPARLTIEILETVIADSDNDMIVQNIATLSRFGCGIDLDDFGTGHASITNIRRFAVNRIKIDRSFVTHVDQDRDQQLMVAAILSMADRLGLQTLAEGVESIGEHAMLAQLGCGHVQGFGLAQPMPFAETADWIARHRATLARVPPVTHRTA